MQMAAKFLCCCGLLCRHTTLSDISNTIVGKYYYPPFDITHYFSFDVGFTYSVVQSSEQFGVETK